MLLEKGLNNILLLTFSMAVNSIVTPDLVSTMLFGIVNNGITMQCLQQNIVKIYWTARSSNFFAVFKQFAGEEQTEKYSNGSNIHEFFFSCFPLWVLLPL